MEGKKGKATIKTGGAGKVLRDTPQVWNAVNSRSILSPPKVKLT